MGVGKIFSGGDHLGIFPELFQGGAKSGEICFFPIKTKKKQPFFAKKFKFHGGKPPCPTSDAHGCSLLQMKSTKQLRFLNVCSATNCDHTGWCRALISLFFFVQCDDRGQNLLFVFGATWEYFFVCDGNYWWKHFELKLSFSFSVYIRRKFFCVNMT